MVGSAFGWVEAPYLPCPENLHELADSAVRIRDGVHVVPGMRCTNPLGAPDVMRGEETQLLGALCLGQLSGAARHLVCMPGTHTKWVSLSGGVVQEFLTAPTGEIFGLLCEHSVLVRDKTTPITHVAPDFERGLAEAVRHPGAFVHQIFQARSLRLDKQLSAEGAASWTSGLLIGADVGGALAMFGIGDSAPVLVIGAPRSPSPTRWRWRGAAARPCRSTARRPHSPVWARSSGSGSAHEHRQERGNGRHPARAHATTRARGRRGAGRRRLPLHRGAAQFP